MQGELPFSNWSLKKTLANQTDTFIRARIKIIYFIIVFTLLKIFILLPVAYFYGQDLQLVRGVIIFVVYIALLKYVLYDCSKLKLISHAILFTGVLFIWSNVFIYAQSINIATVQLIFMSILCGFYLLNKRWGLIYSAVCSLPILVHFVLEGRVNLFNTVHPQQLSSPGYEIIVVLNFVSIIISHYLFYQAFELNLEEKALSNKRMQIAITDATKMAESRSDFLSTMSHELRTPLNSVIGMTNILLEDSHDAEQKDNLKILKFSAVSLLTLINDILDFTKIEADKVQLEAIPFNLAEMIENSCAGLRLKAKEKGLLLNVEVDDILKTEAIVSDPTRLTQIIYNLVGNAIKFTSHGRIAVSAKSLFSTPEFVKVQFVVSDTGIGISPERHDAVFETFTQATNNITRKFGGTGLGLAIVKRLLTLFNSAITLKSTLGKGSDFSFDIDFIIGKESIPLNEIGAPEQKNVDLAGLKVLIAEDNQMNIVLMRKLLSRWNIECIIAENGQEALEKASKDSYDVILMDLHMPIMNGYDATRNIRILPQPLNPKVHIIALTASVSHNVYAKIKEAGLNDYLNKPFNPQDLRKKLEKLMKIKQLQPTRYV